MAQMLSELGQRGGLDPAHVTLQYTQARPQLLALDILYTCSLINILWYAVLQYQRSLLHEYRLFLTKHVKGNTTMYEYEEFGWKLHIFIHILDTGLAVKYVLLINYFVWITTFVS